MYPRFVTSFLLDALSDSPVVLINGARQTGKTTLVRALAEKQHPATYLTLDDASVLSAVRSDPAGFLAGLSGSVVLDEVQHAPELFPAIKATVDRQRTPGRFLLTGSANILLLPKVSESLAGRMEILTLWPLSQAEMEGHAINVCDTLFASHLPTVSLPAVSRPELVRRLVVGGYPEPVSRRNETRRQAWFNAYLTTILQRDVRDIANIEGLAALPRLLALLAARSAGLLNLSDIARAAALPYATLYRYMAVLEATFLVQYVPAWSHHLGTRLVKAPKLHLLDTGLVANLLGLNAERLLQDRVRLGFMVENFVAMEVQKQASWSQIRPQLYHYRTHTGHEVDLVLEEAAGQVVGIEVKTSANVSAADFKGLKALQEAVGERFVRGVVLYTGDQAIPFGERLHALPISLLWQLLG